MADATNRENFILMTVGGLTLDPVTKTPMQIAEIGGVFRLQVT